MKKTIALLLTAALCLSLSPAAGAESYIYNFGGENGLYPCPTPAPYRHADSYWARELGIEGLSQLAGISAGPDAVYITCGGQLLQTDHALAPKQVLTEVTVDGEAQQLTELAGVWAAANGDVYVCEPKRSRVLHFGPDLELVRVLGKPAGMVLAAGVTYAPSKIAVDAVGRMYVVASNVYEGIVEINADGSFSRYFGQVKVTYTLAELGWRAIQTDTQRATSSTWLPVNFSNLTIDEDGFVLATVAGEQEENPIRKLNAKGADILRYPTDPDWPPSGDWWTNSSGATVPAGLSSLSIIDSTAFGAYLVFDSKRSHIFGYDEDGYMLFAFGEAGIGAGRFQNVTDFCILDDRLVFLDAGSLSLEVFEVTDYGRAILDATRYQYESNYRQSAEEWRKVVDYCPAFQYAYVGVGKALYRDGDVEQAEEYFKMGQNVEYYSMAFQKSRQNFLGNNFVWFILAAVAIAALVLARKGVRRWKKRR